MKHTFTDPIVRNLVDKKYHARYVPETNVVLVSKNNQEAYFIDGYTPLVPYNLGIIFSNKQIVKHILASVKIPTPNGFICNPDNLHMLHSQLRQNELAFPLFIRQENSQLPIRGSGPLTDIPELEKAFLELSKSKQLIMVESYVPGEILHVFATSTGFLNVLIKHQRRSETLFANEQLANVSNEKYMDVTSQYALPKLKQIVTKLASLFQTMPYVCFTVVYRKNHSIPFVVTEIFHSAKRHYFHTAQKNNKKIKIQNFITDEVIKRCFADVT